MSSAHSLPFNPPSAFFISTVTYSAFISFHLPACWNDKGFCKAVWAWKKQRVHYVTPSSHCNPAQPSPRPGHGKPVAKRVRLGTLNKHGHRAQGIKSAKNARTLLTKLAGCFWYGLSLPFVKEVAIKPFCATCKYDRDRGTPWWCRWTQIEARENASCW